MKLPNAQEAQVERRKINDYLLSLTSPDGESKARFFLGFGFRVERWQEFGEALKAQGTAFEVTGVRETDSEVRYAVDGPIATPDGRNPRIRTVWEIVRGGSVPRLVTAFPRRK